MAKFVGPAYKRVMGPKGLMTFRKDGEQWLYESSDKEQIKALSNAIGVKEFKPPKKAADK